MVFLYFPATTAIDLKRRRLMSAMFGKYSTKDFSIASDTPCGNRLVNRECPCRKPKDYLRCGGENRFRQAVGLRDCTRTSFVYAQDNKDVFDLETELKRGRGGDALKQRRQRDRQPARLERIVAAPRLHQRGTPSGKRLYRLAEPRTP